MSKPWRPRLSLPNGRTVSGRQPGDAPSSLLEHDLRDELARQVCGVTELVLPYGRADVATAATVWEVEPAPQYRTAVRQVLSYAAQSGLAPAIALFGPAHRDDVVRVYVRLRDGHPRIALWWWSERRWHEIYNRRECRNMRDPLWGQDGGNGPRSTATGRDQRRETAR